MRVLVVSVHRSGTYLTCKMLQRDLKLPHDGLHINHVDVQNQMVDFQHFKEGIIDAEHAKKCHKQGTTMEFLALAKDKAVVATHLAWEQEVEDFLRQMFDKVYYAKRNPRASFLSSFYWNPHMGFQAPGTTLPDYIRHHGVDLKLIHDAIAPWEKRADEVFNYEDLVKNPENLKLKTPTDARGTHPTLKEVWTSECEDAFNALGW